MSRSATARPEEGSAEGWTWLDLRLGPPVITVWSVSLVAHRLPAVVLAGSAAAALIGGVALTRRRGAAAALVLGVLAALAVTAGTAATRAAVRDSSPLRQLAQAGRAVSLVVELDGDPHRLRGPGPPRIVVDATATLVEDRGETIPLNDPVLLFAPADPWRDLLPGQSVRTRAALTAPRAGDDVVAVLSARDPPTATGTAGWAQGAAGGLREGLARSAARTLEPRPAGLLPGLVVGDVRRMDPVLVEDFRRAGLTHLTAVSGANVAIVLAGVLWPLRRRAVDRRVQALVATAALVDFVVLARPSPSVLRAAAMAGVTLVALASGRARAAVPALATATGVLLLVDPGLATDAGFALSVAATAAIVLLAPTWSRRLRHRGWPPPLADALAVSAAAGIATAPLIAGLSGQVTLVSLPANLLAAPAVAPATVLGLLATLAAALAPPVGDALVWLAGWPVRWLVLVAERTAAIPDGAAAWPAGVVGAVALTLLFLGAGALLWRCPRLRPLAVAAVVGLVVVGWPVRQTVRGWPPPQTVAVACDVGQGDAFVVPSGPGQGVLVDAGPDVAAVDRCLDRLGIQALPLVLLSHLDADHVGGLAGALAGRAVGTVATGTLSPADDRGAAVARMVRGAGARSTVLLPGDRLRVGTAAIEVLAPPPEIAVASAAANDLSVVARITQHGVRVLFTGDLGAEAESRILARGTDLRADVLKVPHHGSADADPDFLAATGARVALISVGADNDYGHPTARLLRWLARAGMRVHRTDLAGDVAVAGRAGNWGVAARGKTSGAPSAAGAPQHRPGRLPHDPAPGVVPPVDARIGRYRVAACRRGSGTPGTDLPAARRGGGGGTAPRSRVRSRSQGGARAPPRRRAARTGRAGLAGRPAGRRAGAVPLRRPPAGRGERRAGGGGRARRRTHRLRPGSRPGPDPGRRPLRWEAQRSADQGLHRRRRGR